METDYSKQLYDTYYTLKNRTVELILKDGRHIHGLICGFFRGDVDSNEPYIIKWHIVREAELKMFGTTILGYITGEIIKQEDIVKVNYTENKTDEL